MFAALLGNVQPTFWRRLPFDHNVNHDRITNALVTIE